MQNTIANNKPAQEQDRRKGDLYILGRLGVAALKAMQGSARLFFIPAIKAAAPTEAPTKPPPMKHQNLPLYDCPHLKYQNHETDKDNRPDQDVKILQNMLLPTVTEYRQDISNTLGDIKHELVDTYNEIAGDFKNAEKQFLTYMRDPKNRTVSVLFVGAAALLGLRIGKTMPRRAFASGLALIVSGAICYPAETDKLTGTLMYYAGKTFVPLYNLFGTGWDKRERVACPKDVSEIPKPPTKPLPGCAKQNK